MEYLGEWTGIASFGQGLIALAFGASFVSLVAFLWVEIDWAQGLLYPRDQHLRDHRLDLRSVWRSPV